ncbi:MAG: hypothetical protein HYY53_00170 [candidate division NC10 bacterium]|nr:hypothetical protein [candidate division NC10 bacterium]
MGPFVREALRLCVRGADIKRVVQPVEVVKAEFLARNIALELDVRYEAPDPGAGEVEAPAPSPEARSRRLVRQML